MPAVPVQDMISNIRDIVDDESAYTHSDAELLRYINNAVGHYDAFLTIHAEHALMQSKTITHDGSELQAVLPYLPRIISVERTSDDPRTETVPLPRGFKDRLEFLQQSAGSTPGYYYIQNNQLAVVPQQTTPSVDKVWMVLRSPELHYGAGDATSTTTSLILDATPTLGNLHAVGDAYNQVPVMLTTVREVNVIADYTRATRACTLQFTFENDPASLAYSTLPVIDPEFHWLYIWQAIIIGRMRTDENKVDPVSERTRLEYMLLAIIRKNTVQKNKYITRHGF